MRNKNYYLPTIWHIISQCPRPKIIRLRLTCVICISQKVVQWRQDNRQIILIELLNSIIISYRRQWRSEASWYTHDAGNSPDIFFPPLTTRTGSIANLVLTALVTFHRDSIFSSCFEPPIKLKMLLGKNYCQLSTYQTSDRIYTKEQFFYVFNATSI